MNWILRIVGQRPRLEKWLNRPFSVGAENGPRANDRRDAYACIVGHEPPGVPLVDGPFRRVANAIGCFDIFPPRLVTPVLQREPIQTGDAVGFCYRFLPGLSLFFASRVIDVFDGDEGGIWKAGFTYRTLQGHPMCGEETFSVEKDLATGEVRAGLCSWSRPGSLLARITKPIMRWFQVRASRAALGHLKHIAATEVTLLVAS